MLSVLMELHLHYMCIKVRKLTNLLSFYKEEDIVKDKLKHKLLNNAIKEVKQY
jgi:hypothetical protein